MPERFKVHPHRPEEGPIQAAVRELRQGRAVVYPTETFYAAGVNALDPEAVNRLFALKGRPKDQPVTLVVVGNTAVLALARSVPPVASILMKRFWPGPLTLLFEAAGHLPPALHAGTGRIGIRVPSHLVARALLREAEMPLTATSANRSGSPPPSSVDAALESLGDAPDLAVVLDAGSTPGGAPSTILDVTQSPPKLVRPGAVPEQEIWKALKGTRV